MKSSPETNHARNIVMSNHSDGDVVYMMSYCISWFLQDLKPLGYNSVSSQHFLRICRPCQATARFL